MHRGSLIPPFHYRVNWQPRSRRPGEHPSAVSGEGGSFRGERLLTDASQARFLSIRASIRDPLRRLWVRENQQRATLDVFVVIDVSRSMRVGAHGRFCQAAGDLLASAALSAYRSGDRIGAVCASAQIDPRLTIMPGRRLQPAFALADAIRAMPARSGRWQAGLDSVEGLLDVWRRLSMRRSLILLVSDFHAPLETWEEILRTLRRHQVVPVVMQDQDASSALPRWGLVHMDDAETGRSRALLMRPSLQRRLADSVERRQVRLSAMFERLGLRPCRLDQPFDPGQLTSYFHAAWPAKAPEQTAAGALPGDAGRQPPPGREGRSPPLPPAQ